MQIGELELDPAARVVRRGGQAIALSRGEFAVLEALARRAGRIVSAAVLAQCLCDDLTDIAPDGVAAYITRLRKKVDRGFDQPLILTRHGWGYYLRCETPAEKSA